MKLHSESHLILAGSVFLAGLVIADVLMKRARSLHDTGRSEEMASTVTFKPSEPDHAEAIQAVQLEEAHSAQPEKEEAEDTPELPTTVQPEPQPNAQPATPIFADIASAPPPVRKQESKPEPIPAPEISHTEGYTHLGTQLPQVQYNVFFQALRPHGKWFRHGQHGTCWIPKVSQNNSQWRPYLNDGKWKYTQSGWLWVSDYRWGGYPFHYGRWFHTSEGWAWKPEGHWSTAWVSWRNAGQFCGWAPLPPAQLEKTSTELTPTQLTDTSAAGQRPRLTPDHFVFLSKEDLFKDAPLRHILDAEKAKSAFRLSRPSDYFALGPGKRLGNRGIPLNELLPWIENKESREGTAQTPNQPRTVKGQVPVRNGTRQGTPGVVRGTWTQYSGNTGPTTATPMRPAVQPQTGSSATVRSGMVTPRVRTQHIQRAEQVRPVTDGGRHTPRRHTTPVSIGR